MNQFPILLKREFWEHRNTFIVLPLVTTGFMILMMVGFYIAVDIGGINADITPDRDGSSHQVTRDEVHADEAFELMLSKLASLPPSEREHKLYKILNGLGTPLLVILSIVVFFYLIVSLYNDRKDRSILFWKSMPVSDINTVAAKLVTALLLVPAVYLVCLAVVQLVFLIIASLAAMGQDVSIWAALWEPSNLVGRWLTLIVYVLFQAIWNLPFYGWMILVSAWANSVPLAWIIGIPIAFSVAERIVSDDNLVSAWFASHASPVVIAHDQELQITDLLPRLLDIDTILGLSVGLVFVCGAIWLMGRGDEI